MFSKWQALLVISCLSTVGFVVGKSIAGQCVKGCNVVEARYWVAGSTTCLAFTPTPMAYDLQQVVTGLGGPAIPGTGNTNSYTCPSCTESCTNNPLDPSREQEPPVNWMTCTLSARPTVTTCTGV